MIQLTSQLRSQGLDAYIKKLPDAIDGGAVAAAHFVRDRAYALAPKDTTSLAESIVVQTHDGSDYAARTAAARSVNPKVVLIPEPPKPARKGAANVMVAAKHSHFIEFGTVHMAPQPFFTPAVEAGRVELVKAMREAVKP